MFYYYLIIGFQAYCIFHAYKKRNDYFWYVVIFFLPFIGALIYFFSQIIKRKKIIHFYNLIIDKLLPKKKIKDLHKKLANSNTFKNNVNLADAYYEKKKFNKAIIYYENALVNSFKNDSQTINKTLGCYFEVKNYEKVIEYGNKIDLERSFRSSIYPYAIALEKRNFLEKAELYFRKTNRKYTNYIDRLELSKFLLRNKKNDEAKLVLNEIIFEIDNMTEFNQKKHKPLYIESKKLLKEN